MKSSISCGILEFFTVTICLATNTMNYFENKKTDIYGKWISGLLMAPMQSVANLHL